MDGASRIRRGSPAFRRTNIALFLSGFSVFALLYSVQPLLPIFARDFGLDAGQSSLSLSVTTMALATSLLAASGAADRYGRKALMVASLGASAVLGVIVPLAPDWNALLAARAALGLALSGVPAVAMVYLAEEIEASGFGFSVGLYIGGNAIGGMTGRILVGSLADFVSWRFALLALALIGVVNAILFWRLLPRPRHSPPRGISGPPLWRRVARQFRDPALRWLYAESFLVMGVFVTLYNYTGFRLSAPRFGLSHAAISLIFTVYLIGTGASAWIGGLAGRVGRRKVLWLMVAVMGAGLAITGIDRVTTIIAGLAVVTFGFFGAHSVASSWVARRAGEGKAQASALYLFFYYFGSSVIGTAGGYAWSAAGWTGVILVDGVAIVAALAIALRLVFIPPLSLPEGRMTPLPPA